MFDLLRRVFYIYLGWTMIDRLISLRMWLRIGFFLEIEFDVHKVLYVEKVSCWNSMSFLFHFYKVSSTDTEIRE